jgi:conjugal transfer pilus assembly protein TraE
MDFSFQHTQSQRTLRQRNMLMVTTAVLGCLSVTLLFLSMSRDREIVLQPILRTPVTVSSAGVSREYLEMVTRDAALLTLERSPQNLDYWMESVLALTAPRMQGKIKRDLLAIVNEQRGSSIAQYFTIQSMKIDTKGLSSEVTGDLRTIVGSKVVSTAKKTFRFDWEYTGLSLKLIGFGMIVEEKKGS